MLTDKIKGIVEIYPKDLHQPKYFEINEDNILFSGITSKNDNIYIVNE